MAPQKKSVAISRTPKSGSAGFGTGPVSSNGGAGLMVTGGASNETAGGGLRAVVPLNIQVQSSVEKQLMAKMVRLRNQYWTEITEMREKMRNMAPYMTEAVNECLFNEEPRYTFEPDEFMVEEHIDYMRSVVREKIKLVGTKCSAAAKLQIDKTVGALRESRVELAKSQKEVADLEATNEALERKINILKSQMKSQKRSTVAKASAVIGSVDGEAAEMESVSGIGDDDMDPVAQLMEAEDRIRELQMLVNRLEQEKYLAEGHAETQQMLMVGEAAVGSQTQAAEMAQLEEDLRAAKSDAMKWQKELEASDFKLKLAAEDLETLQSKYDAGVGGMERHCKELEAELNATKKSLEKTDTAISSRIEAATKSMEAANKELQRQLAEAMAERERLEKENIRLEKDNESAVKEIEELRGEKEEIKTTLEARVKELADAAKQGGEGSMKDGKRIKELEKQLERANEMLEQLQKRSIQGDSASKNLMEELEGWKKRAESAEEEIAELKEVIKENEAEIGELREAALRKVEEEQDVQDEGIGDEVAEPSEKDEEIEVDLGVTSRISELEEENKRLTLVLVELREKMGEMATKLEQGGVSGGVVDGILEDVGLANFAGRGKVRRATRNVFNRLYEDALRRMKRLGELRERVRTLQEQEFLAIYYSRVGYRTFIGYDSGWMKKRRQRKLVDRQTVGEMKTVTTTSESEIERATPINTNGWSAPGGGTAARVARMFGGGRPRHQGFGGEWGRYFWRLSLVDSYELGNS
ncbi:hypothetical protein FOL47_007167 [Perkinsus chesapeaki]|uniref:Uncharacterized protein n=1 Tax=Perkinsus chesapeaki TaxID=330153 RepID=A0A7J6LMD8_PERCH|nr:hypothetical protein FOL47_007167 [Perkinsus chesapeaki]